MTCRKIFLLCCVLIMSVCCCTHTSRAYELLETNNVLSPAVRLQEQAVQNTFSQTKDDERFNITTGGETLPDRLENIHAYILTSLLAQIFPSGVSLRILDVGVGDTAGTTFKMLELADEVKGFNIEVVGIDRDENTVREANEQASRRGLDSKIHFLTAQNLRIPVKGNVVFSFNVLRYYSENDFQEMVDRLGNAVEENGILVIGNNDVNEINSLIAFVFQKKQGELQKRQVIFGLQERLNERFNATSRGFPQNDKSIRSFRADVPGARIEVQRGEFFSFEQALGSKGYIITRKYGLVVKTLAELSKQSISPALVRKTEAIVSENNREILVQRAI